MRGTESTEEKPQCLLGRCKWAPSMSSQRAGYDAGRIAGLVGELHLWRNICIAIPMDRLK